MSSVGLLASFLTFLSNGGMITSSRAAMDGIISRTTHHRGTTPIVARRSFKEVMDLTRIPRAALDGEAKLLFDIRAVGLPMPTHYGKNQLRFAARIVGLGPGIRKRLKAAGMKDWRFDLAWDDHHRLAVEAEGGVFMGKGHTGGVKFGDDCRKYNIAQLYGWMVLRYTTDHIFSGIAINELEEYFRRNP